MILPSGVKTRHKIRDTKILLLYSQGHSQDSIAKIVKLHQTRISAILYKNRDVLRFDKNFEKAKRINRLQRIYNNCSDEISPKKDVLDVMGELRKELEGEKGVSVETRVLVQVGLEPKDNESGAENNRLESSPRSSETV